MLRKPKRAAALAAGLFIALTGLTLAFEAPTDDGVLDSGKEEHGRAHSQHGTTAGHIDVDNYGVDLISKLELTTAEGRVADVGVWNGFAYLGKFRQDACGGPEGSKEPDGGVYVVDIRDPENPKKVTFLPVFQDSYVGEGVQTLTITTAKFRGDLLALNSESCGKNFKGGFTLYDVTNPYKASKLTENFGDKNVSLVAKGSDANDIHSVFVWEDENGTTTDADDRAYIVVTDNPELTDVDIFDITDPRHPVMVGEFDLEARYPSIVDPTLGPASGFLHDMIVKEIDGHEIMLVSYWDSGYVLINVDDPSDPKFIADTDFGPDDPLAPGRIPEGNGHEAEFTADNQYVVAADEDFGPFALTGTNEDEGTPFSMTSGSNTPALEEGATINGPTRYVGRACPGDPAVPVGDGTQVALVERGVCDFTVKQAAVEAAGGYLATITFSREGADACEAGLTMLIDGTIPAFFVARSVGFDFLDLAYNETACLAGDGSVLAGAAVGTIGDEVTISSTFDGWGYVRLFATDGEFDEDGDDERKLVELDQFAIPEAHDPNFATGFGDLSVHEAATSHEADDIVYFSYYSGGFRVLRIVDDELVEVGAFIDKTGDTGNNLWGVQVFEDDGVEYVAASDRDYGLYIFKYTGEGSPNS
jgi:hypothetical protein